MAKPSRNKTSVKQTGPMPFEFHAFYCNTCKDIVNVTPTVDSSGDINLHCPNCRN